MKKFFLIVIVLGLTSYCCFAQFFEETYDLFAPLDKKENVKCITEYNRYKGYKVEYLFNREGYPVEEKYYYKGSLYAHCIYIYIYGFYHHSNNETFD